MAVTRLKNSGIKTGSVKSDSALAGQSSLPSTPTIGTATAGSSSATVAFTAGGIAGTTYRALSNPGGLTGTSATSPITVSGLTNGTAYTFQVRAENAVGSSAYSSSSNSVTPVATYSLALTANNTQNWTVPAGVSKIAVYVFSGGAGGRNGGDGTTGLGSSNTGGFGAGGGGGGAAAAFSEYTVTPGTSYIITVGAGGVTAGSGSASSFGNLATANGGAASPGSNSNATSNVAGAVTSSGAPPNASTSTRTSTGS